jgi:hypothetical protein
MFAVNFPSRFLQTPKTRQIWQAVNLVHNPPTTVVNGFRNSDCCHNQLPMTALMLIKHTLITERVLFYRFPGYLPCQL